MRRLAILTVWLLVLKANAFSQYSEKIDTNRYPFDFTTLNDFSFGLKDNDSIIPIAHGKKFYVINSYTKKPIGDSLKEYDLAYPFSGNCALIKNDGKYGVIDRKGNYVLNPAYDRFYVTIYPNYILFAGEKEYFSFNWGKFIADTPKTYVQIEEPVGPQMSYRKSNGGYTVILKNGKNLPPLNDSVLYLGFDYEVLKKGKKIGVINSLGETIFPFKYKDFKVERGADFTKQIFSLKKAGIWHYYHSWYGSRSLKELFKSPVALVEINDDMIIFKIHGLYNYMNNEGNVMLPNNYKWISSSGYKDE